MLEILFTFTNMGYALPKRVHVEWALFLNGCQTSSFTHFPFFKFSLNEFISIYHTSEEKHIRPGMKFAWMNFQGWSSQYETRLWNLLHFIPEWDFTPSICEYDESRTPSYFLKIIITQYFCINARQPFNYVTLFCYFINRIFYSKNLTLYPLFTVILPRPLLWRHQMPDAMHMTTTKRRPSPPTHKKVGKD